MVSLGYFSEYPKAGRAKNKNAIKTEKTAFRIMILSLSNPEYYRPSPILLYERNDAANREKDAYFGLPEPANKSQPREDTGTESHGFNEAQRRGLQFLA